MVIIKVKAEKTIVRGYKAFNADWTCRGKQYACDDVFKEDVEPEISGVGMHFCLELKDCFKHTYSFDPAKTKIAEVTALGKCIEENGYCSTNHLYIVREVPWDEVCEILGVDKEKPVVKPKTKAERHGLKLKKASPVYTHDEAAAILEQFEKVLDQYGIRVPSPEDDEREDDNGACLYGSVYSDLLDDVEDLLLDMLKRYRSSGKVVPGVFSGDF